MPSRLLQTSLAFTASLAALTFAAHATSLGPRPFFLIEQMQDSPLKEKLQACAKDFDAGKPIKKTLFSIGHRGAPLQFPEHTKEGYTAAARMGAGIVECDVTFTKDKELVCRHSQKDLATSTNILQTDLAATCIQPFEPAASGNKAKASCQTADILLSEFKHLTGKMDNANKKAVSVQGFLDGTTSWRTNLYANMGGTLLSHKESIALFKDLGVKFTPELKAPSVTMPFDGMSQEDYAQMLIDEYKDADIPASSVWPQSFNLKDIEYWIENEPDFGKQAIFLDGRARDGLKPQDPSTFSPTMAELKEKGINYIAPPLWMLLSLHGETIVPSAYAKEAKKAGLNIITWTLERSGPLNNGGGWYYQSVKDVINHDGQIFEVLDILAKEVGVVGVFSDWPATTSFYANCMGLK
ncbi:MAG: glycerophosphodiester phosphodiesterase family protein [Cohaesibacter sp.]|jgi:glycerophosphoryl diester phosphodiesterase|nr:glycerophosphodiester phosphodiesterase family protein [Cohaesibacter sp.]